LAGQAAPAITENRAKEKEARDVLKYFGIIHEKYLPHRAVT
jgi:hypothetical protein